MNFCIVVLYFFILLKNMLHDKMLEESVFVDRRKLFHYIYKGHLVWGKPGQISSQIAMPRQTLTVYSVDEKGATR